jgi:hypothetical protein
MKRLINATLGLGTAALLSLAACGGDGADMDTGMADTGLGATVPAPAPAPMDTMMADTMMADSTMRDSTRDTTTTPPPGN